MSRWRETPRCGTRRAVRRGRSRRRRPGSRRCDLGDCSWQFISAIHLGDVSRRLIGRNAFLMWQVPAAVVSYALYLGMTFPEDAPLLWIAEQALIASDYHHDDSRATWPC